MYYRNWIDGRNCPNTDEYDEQLGEPYQCSGGSGRLPEAQFEEIVNRQ